MFYKYHYAGRLGTGAPNLRSQVSGTGIEFDVLVKMTSEKEAIIKVKMHKNISYAFQQMRIYLIKTI